MKLGCTSEATLLIQRASLQRWRSQQSGETLLTTAGWGSAICYLPGQPVQLLYWWFSGASDKQSPSQSGWNVTIVYKQPLNRLMRRVLPGMSVLLEASSDAYARIHHCRLKKFNASSFARFLDPTIKHNLHNFRIDFNRYSQFNFVCIKFGTENCFVFDVTHLQEIWPRPIS